MVEEPVRASYMPPIEAEAESISLQWTEGCPWKKCRFCPLNEYTEFKIKPVEQIKKEIDGWKNYLEKEGELDKRTTVFIGDADSIIMKTDNLVKALEYLYEQFPKITRVTSYARAHTIQRKSSEELIRIRKAGLHRLHVGLESGYDLLLMYMNKGLYPTEMVDAGLDVKKAGFELSEYVILGLGGKLLTVPHALATADILNQINPDFVRFRNLIPKKNTPMYYDYLYGQRYEHGWFKILSPHGVLRETRMIIENLTITGSLMFDHRSNVIPAYYWRTAYKLPEMKEEILKIIDETLKVDESKLTSGEDYIDMLGL
jgi:radical SAM superfamily enzyme YgiQ (UPF0313 family)